MMWVLDMVVVGMAVAAGFYLGWWLRERKWYTESLCDGCEKLRLKRESVGGKVLWECATHLRKDAPVLYCCDYKQRGGGNDQGV